MNWLSGLLAVGGHIDDIFAAGDDALANQFSIEITELAGLFALPNPIKIRTVTCNIPNYAVGTYTVDYKTQKFTKPSGKIDTPNEFQFSFRVDKYWTTYQALLAWKRFIADEESGAMAEDVGAISGVSSFRTDIIVRAIDSNDVETYSGWKFHQAWPSTLDAVSFDQASGEAIILPVTFQFLKMTPLI